MSIIDRLGIVVGSSSPASASTPSAELAIKTPVRVATTANITLSGTQTIDGVAVVAGDRVLVKDQTSAIQNGIYVVSSGTWSRATDFDGARDIIDGALVSVTHGSTNAQIVFMVVATDPVTIGTSSIAFSPYFSRTSVSLTLTRQQISSTTITQNTFVVSGYATAGDLGAGAIYTSTGASVSSVGAIQDAGGTWFRLVESGVVHVGWFGAKGDGVTNDTVAIQAAHDAAPVVIYDTPSVKYNVTSIVLQTGAVIVGGGGGAGEDVGPAKRSTIINGTTNSFVYTLDCPVSDQIDGPIFKDVQITCLKNGIRLNSSTGGQPGIGGVTQGFIFNSYFRGVQITSTVAGGYGIQASVAFHTVIEQCDIGGPFISNIDIYYSDVVRIANNRMYQGTTALIRATALNSFGSHLLIEQNDLLALATGATGFIVSDYANPTIRNNYFEQIPAEGTGITASIVLLTGTQSFYIEDNLVSTPSSCMTNWLNVTSVTLHNAVITGNYINGSGGVGPATFNSGLGVVAWFNGGAANTRIIHHGNTTEDGIPLNTINTDDALPLYPNALSVMTPSVSGAITARDYGSSAYILKNELVIPPTGAGYIVTWEDQRHTITGTVAVKILAYASSAMSSNILVQDNHVNVTTLNISLTTVPKWYTVTIASAIATSLQVVVSGATSSTTAYVQAIVVENANVTTAANFADKTHAINTVNKFASKQAWVSDAARNVFAAGSGATDVWKDGVNSTVYTPS